MSRAAVTLEPQASIQDAAKVMKKHRVSSIMVTQNKQLAGL
ncbi:CBS domain-containing protein [Pseudoalteromonas sp. R3]|nr:CBS domain-containing protein [Pseudoalteromonas sp. R3]